MKEREREKEIVPRSQQNTPFQINTEEWNRPFTVLSEAAEQEQMAQGLFLLCFLKSLLDLLISKAEEIQEVLARQKHSFYLLCALLTCQGINFPVSLFTFYYKTCINFQDFFHRDISFRIM